MLEVNTRPKSTALYERIRKHILEGQYFPGQWLKQADLEESYNASRSEVRAALSTLAERGIVEYIKNRGFRIFNRSPEEIREIVEMIVVLEAAAAPGIVKNATDKDIDELEKLAQKFDSLIISASHAELRLTNYRFHDMLNSLCGNNLMAQTIRNLRECCVSGPFQRYTTFSGLQESSCEHFDIVSAVRKRDAGALESLLRQHATHAT
tara:strand:- start:6702 stop:7325 length:624 start_codon:yes stop_codon:yes gene_type:complete